ncbi:MAG: F0F1 ATP synthase subunit A, partial [FCB group bacterium]|nr:F0F1 ATP synthase subunit A [FCB group bacterium]
MAKKKSPILKIFILFIIIEVVLVIVSSGFNKRLQVGFDDGKIIFRNIQSHYDLQERITEEFQIDEHYRQTGETPEIYSSNKIYEFFKTAFGQASAIGTFQLLRMLLIVDILLLFLAFLIKKKLLKRPSQPQILFEMTYSTLEQFVIETLGKDKVNYTPYIVTLFLFIWVSNMVGMIPIPGFMEPTRNLNVPLGLGIFAVAIVHITAFKVKGAWGHLQNY